MLLRSAFQSSLLDSAAPWALMMGMPSSKGALAFSNFLDAGDACWVVPMIHHLCQWCSYASLQIDLRGRIFATPFGKMFFQLGTCFSKASDHRKWAKFMKFDSNEFGKNPTPHAGSKCFHRLLQKSKKATELRSGNYCPLRIGARGCGPVVPPLRSGARGWGPIVPPDLVKSNDLSVIS